MAPVRFARAFQWSIRVAAFAGCVVTAGSALAQGQNDLDYMTYGRPAGYAAPHPSSDGGGAIAALRRALSSAPRPTYNYTQPPASAPPPASPPPVIASTPYDAYAATPVAAPIRYDAGCRLDAGDKLRVVVYGQDGLTNTYTID